MNGTVQKSKDEEAMELFLTLNAEEKAQIIVLAQGLLAARG